MKEVTIGGPELAGFAVAAPASSIRLLLPTRDLVVPEWNGNEFLLPDGSRPPIRTLTPLRFDATSLELDLEIVIHEEGALSAWATAVSSGDEVALTGPGRGTTVDPDAHEWLIVGDETAIPAIGQLIDALPGEARASVLIEIRDHNARHPLPDRPAVRVEWLTQGSAPGTSIADAVRSTSIVTGAHVWAAGEAAAMQRIRRHLFDDRGIPRDHTVIRGYWKHGRAGT